MYLLLNIIIYIFLSWKRYQIIIIIFKHFIKYYILLPTSILKIRNLRSFKKILKFLCKYDISKILNIIN